MKRIGFLLVTTTVFVMCLAAPAFAVGCPSSGGCGPPGVSGSGGTVGGTAFTGGNVSTSFLYLAVFVVAGALSISFSRRRSLTTR